VVSDPFPEAGGIAVHVTTKKDSNIRELECLIRIGFQRTTESAPDTVS
jgi:hypothetical protein